MNWIQQFIALPRQMKRLILLLVDVTLLLGALLAAFSLRLGEWYWPPEQTETAILLLLSAAPVVATPIFAYFGLYRAIIRYLGIRAAWSVVQAVSLYAVLWGLLALLSGVPGIPRSVVLINALVALLAIGGSRALARWLLVLMSARNQESSRRVRAVIYGAGDAGRQLAVGLLQSHEYHLFGFVEDDKDLQGREMMGVPVVSQQELPSLIERHQVTDLLLAIPSASRSERNHILEQLRSLPLRIRTLPDLMDLAQGRVNLSDLHDLDIEDLLAREPAEPDETLLRKQVEGGVVLVTGAGGSIGSELCRQILRRRPKTLLLLEISEYALYTIHQDLLSLGARLEGDGRPFLAPRVIPLLGSVQNELRLRELLQTWKPSVIFHAAAYKHVPMVEHNLAEGLRNNVFGTLTLAKIAIEQQVENFVLISTDKAVYPTSGMGASKRIAEMVLQALVAEQAPSFYSDDEPPLPLERKTHFSMVRFGNVLGSSGSVVPLFRKQINNGGPITLTHQGITRYFMTIPEAAQLVMQAGEMSGKEDAAEVFVLDMGKSVRIYDLAKRMVELSGLRVKDEEHPQGDIEIQITGLRPGEKLYEELLIGNDPKPTEHPRILKAHEKFISWDELQPQLQTLNMAVGNNDVEMVRLLMQKLVKGYKPDEKVVDWVYSEQIK